MSVSGRPGAELDVLLLHGAWCGPWVWDEVSDALTAAGLRVAAPRLPIEHAEAGVHDYVSSVLDRTGGAPVKLAIGHSLAGILLEPLAARCPLGSIMYLTAFVPVPGMSLRAQWKTNSTLFRPGWSEAVTSDTGATRWTQIDAAVDYLLNDCRPAEARAAALKLQPQAWALARDRHETPLTTPSTIVTAAHDRLLNSEELRRGGEQITGAAFAELNADHMPMISRPGQLAALIQRVLERRHTQPGEMVI